MDWEKRRIITKIGSGCLALWAAIWHAPPFYAQGLKPITIRALFNREKGFIMKNGFFFLSATALLAACAGATSPQKAVNQEPPPLGTPNPASVFCVQQGGKSVIRKDEGATNTACACSPTARKCMNGRCSAGITNNAQGSLKTG